MRYKSFDYSVSCGQGVTSTPAQGERVAKQFINERMSESFLAQVNSDECYGHWLPEESKVKGA